MTRTASLLRIVRLPLFMLFFCCFALAAAAQTTWYVDGNRSDDLGAGTSWATAKKYVTSGLALATSGDQVWVMKGTYKPTTTTNRISYINLKDGVKLYGGFDGTETLLSQRNEIYNVTILSGDLAGDDVGNATLDGNSENSYQVLHYNTTGNSNFGSGTVYIDGFTVTGGSRGVAGTGRGGALYFKGTTLTANNMIFLNNAAQNAGGAVCVESNNATSTFTNCVFYNNYQSGDIGSAISSLGDHLVTLTNCIVAGNRGTPFEISNTSLSLNNTDVYGNTSLFSGGMFFKYYSEVIAKNSILHTTEMDLDGNPLISLHAENSGNNQSFTYSHISVYDSWGGGFAKNIATPTYFNTANLIGPDGLWCTADDGLHMTCASLSKDAGNPATVLSLDISGNPRIGTVDVGAYEATGNLAVNAIPTARLSVYLSQSGTTRYSNCTSEVLALVSNGGTPVTGGVTATVWLETTQPAQYVKRHYEIAPVSNFATASGTVTLYFTQAEFDDFNTVNGTDLPTGPLDAAGISNLRVEQRTGTSSNGNGLPGSYPTSTYPPETLAPTSVSWNATVLRWEVTFPAAGFGGYFVKTSLTTLPLRWLSVSGNLNTLQGRKLPTITWKVTETDVADYSVEKSTDGVRFASIGRVASRGDGTNTYTLREDESLTGTAWYRILQTDKDGRYSYSKVVQLSVGAAGVAATLTPNPTKGLVTLTVGAHLLNTQAVLFDAGGKQLKSFTLTSLTTSVNLKAFATGIYVLKLADGTSEKIVKQ